MKSIYDFPDIYDRVLCHPPDVVEAEVRSIQALLSRHGISSGHILELACGTSAHGIRLAQNGFEVTGIDTSTCMLAGAQQRAEAAGVALDLRQANILDFHLGGEPYDGAIFMSETFPLITEREAIAAHFQCVRTHLRKGGLSIIDIDAHRRGVGDKYEVWGEKTIPLKNGHVEVWNESFPGDWVTSTQKMVLHCRICLGDNVHETADEWLVRVDNPWHLEVLVDTLPGWSLVGFYSWRDLSEPLVDEQHYFMVLE